jgi:hypothetical protein
MVLGWGKFRAVFRPLLAGSMARARRRGSSHPLNPRL